MGMTEQSEIKAILRAWARWHCSGNGYPGINSIMLARDGCRVDPFRSRPPRAVEPPEDVAQIMQGMMVFTLAGGVKSAAMAAVRAWYLRDKGAKDNGVADDLGVKRWTFIENKKHGELLLDGWMQGWRRHDAEQWCRDNDSVVNC